MSTKNKSASETASSAVGAIDAVLKDRDGVSIPPFAQVDALASLRANMAVPEQVYSTLRRAVFEGEEARSRIHDLERQCAEKKLRTEFEGYVLEAARTYGKAKIDHDNDCGFEAELKHTARVLKARAKDLVEVEESQSAAQAWDEHDQAMKRSGVKVSG